MLVEGDSRGGGVEAALEGAGPMESGVPPAEPEVSSEPEGLQPSREPPAAGPTGATPRPEEQRLAPDELAFVYLLGTGFVIPSIYFFVSGRPAAGTMAALLAAPFLLPTPRLRRRRPREVLGDLTEVFE